MWEGEVVGGRVAASWHFDSWLRRWLEKMLEPSLRSYQLDERQSSGLDCSPNNEEVGMILRWVWSDLQKEARKLTLLGCKLNRSDKLWY